MQDFKGSHLLQSIAFYRLGYCVKVNDKVDSKWKGVVQYPKYSIRVDNKLYSICDGPHVVCAQQSYAAVTAHTSLKSVWM